MSDYAAGDTSARLPKKVATDPRLSGKQKPSNTIWYISKDTNKDQLTVPPPGVTSLHHAATANMALVQMDKENQAESDHEGQVAKNSWILGVSDEVSADVPENSSRQSDHLKTKQAKELYQAKIVRIMELIRAEQLTKQENVNECLKLSADAEHAQVIRIKTVFEKKNNKSTQIIAHLQQKLEVYRRKLKDIEQYGVDGPPRPSTKEAAKYSDKTVSQNVSKQSEFHRIRNKFGSADDINGLAPENPENGASLKVNLPRLVRKGSETLPSDFRYHSAENMFSNQPDSPDAMVFRLRSNDQSMISRVDAGQVALLMQRLECSRKKQQELDEGISELQNQIESNQNHWKLALEEERYRSERLEEQINDMTELHQYEVFNMKQELCSLEEKMEYQLEERTRDLHELVESCQTKIIKMELQQQQQQQLISMESFDNSTVRTLVTKLINVILSLLAVILVLINTVTNLLRPFIFTRLRLTVTFAVAMTAFVVWQFWHFLNIYEGSHLSEWIKNWFKR